jgi:hypothetical protein
MTDTITQLSYSSTKKSDLSVNVAYLAICNSISLCQLTIKWQRSWQVVFKVNTGEKRHYCYLVYSLEFKPLIPLFTKIHTFFSAYEWWNVLKFLICDINTGKVLSIFVTSVTGSLKYNSHCGEPDRGFPSFCINTKGCRQEFTDTRRNCTPLCGHKRTFEKLLWNFQASKNSFQPTKIPSVVSSVILVL